jgi:hypothetical protein
MTVTLRVGRISRLVRRSSTNEGGRRHPPSASFSIRLHFVRKERIGIAQISASQFLTTRFVLVQQVARMERRCVHVIASAAKQSIYPRAETWIASLRSQCRVETRDPPLLQADLPGAQVKSRRVTCGKTTRRANQLKPVQTSCQKYFAFVVGQISGLTPPVSPDERGVAHVTNARWDAVDAEGARDARA